MIKLSKRLSSVAKLVSGQVRLADVGTDHGYIPIYLTQTGVITHGIAMDVNQGPLIRATEHIKEQNLEAYIDTRRSDGLMALSPGEVDSVVIAGMGGNLMIRILKDGSAVADTLSELILQPQSEVEEVRRFLIQSGWRIVDEDMVEEDGKYYFLMKAVLSTSVEMNAHMATEADYRYGALLIARKHPVLLEYLYREERLCEQIYRSLEKQEMTCAIGQRKTELVERLTVIQQALRGME